MDFKKYDELRKKINSKDFEGNNKGLDKWLWRFSFIGNASAIFFASFFVYPALWKTISLHLFDGVWCIIVSSVMTFIFLLMFEITKRYFVRNFSSDYMFNRRKLNPKIVGWFIIASSIIVLSFYLSITGSKNLASTSTIKNKEVETQILTKIDSLNLVYREKRKIYESDNEKLRNVNNELREKISETPLNYVVIRKEYQNNIDKNLQVISNNQTEIDRLNSELNGKISDLKNQLNTYKLSHKSEDAQNIFLFVIIVLFNELIIIIGIYFREYYEYTLFELNQQKFEKIYLKKDRYRALIDFVYANGKLIPGDKVISKQQLIEILTERTNIPNVSKLVDEFLYDMDRLNIFVVRGKRRYINEQYYKAIDIVENFDDVFRIIENMK